MLRLCSTLNISKLLAIVKYYFGDYLETTNNILPKELKDILLCYHGEVFSFNQFGKVVYCHYKKLVPFGRY